MDVARKLIELLSPRERLQLGFLFVIVLIMAFLQMVSVASVLPFLSVAGDPGKIETNIWLNWAFEGLGFNNTNHFLLALASAALLLMVFANSWMAATQWVQIRFALARSHSLSVRLLQHYLNQPYPFFLQRHSADLGKNILGETDQVRMVLISMLKLVSKSMIVLAIIGSLIIYDPQLALILTLVLGGAYGLIYALTRKVLGHLGRVRVQANKARYQLASEAFGAIKDVKLLGRESTFIRHFITPSRRFNFSQGTSIVIGELPRYALEVLAFGGVLVIAIYMLLRGEGFEEAIPALGFYAFAGYRLMPSLQQVFSSFTRVSFGAPALHNLHRELGSVHTGSKLQVPLVIDRGHHKVYRKVLPLNKKLELDCVAFTYEGADSAVLRDVTLGIDANSIVGIIGATGSGKTTLVDIILGLLQPQFGTMRVDGVTITEANVGIWQNGLGYVPQHIALMDDTIARNIAFGIPDEEIDQVALERASKIAKIHDFITSDLPGGYETSVGERGVRLSGGQRQRIGIARALYHDPSVLVFDEATSALDVETETAVMDAINELAGTKTILMIAHRLATLDACQLLLRVHDGGVSSEIRTKNAATFAISI